MYLKLFITLALLYSVKADDEICTCNKEQIESERQQVWELTENMKGEDVIPVLPAVIGPLVPCGNCLNYDRKKRNILTEKKNKSAKKGVMRSEVTPVGVHDRRCPKNYVRVAGRLCIPFDYSDE